MTRGVRVALRVLAFVAAGSVIGVVNSWVLSLWSPQARDFSAVGVTESRTRDGASMRVWVGSNWYSSWRGFEQEDVFGPLSLNNRGQRRAWISEGFGDDVAGMPRSGMEWGRYGPNSRYWRETVGERGTYGPSASDFDYEFAQWSEHGVGWPAVGLHYEVLVADLESPSRWIGVISLPRWRVIPARWRGSVIPVRPEARGLAMNAVFYGGLCFVCFAAFRYIRCGMRMRGGRCPSCAYDLRLDFSCGCSECGWGKG